MKLLLTVTAFTLFSVLLSCTKTDKKIIITGKCSPQSVPKNHIYSFTVKLNVSEEAITEIRNKEAAIQTKISEVINNYDRGEQNLDSPTVLESLSVLIHKELKSMITTAISSSCSLEFSYVKAGELKH